MLRIRTKGVRELGAEGIFGPNREEVTGEWRKLRSEELQDLAPIPCFEGCQVEEV